MKKFLLLSAALISLSCLTNSCKKKGCTDPVSLSFDESADKDDGSCEYGGTGGNTTLVLFPQHHGKAIISGTHSPDSVSHPDSAYIKFNVIESPGFDPSKYDYAVAGEDGEDHVHVHGLKPGKYFIYMTGYDSTVTHAMRGGIPFTLTQTSGEVDLNVPVSEE